MTPPDTIHYSSIDVSGRLRTQYNRIEELADGIANVGLIQPIVLVPLGRVQEVEMSDENVTYEMTFGLDAGGRRHRALGLLLSDGRWDGYLHHASTSTPGKPGFVLKGEDESTPLNRLLTEIAENLDREDPDWRDVVPAITKAWRMSKADANSKGDDVIMRDFGSLLGVGYANLQAAVYIHDDLIAHPDRYKDCNNVRAAYVLLLKQSAIEATKLQVAASFDTPVVEIQNEPRPLEGNGTDVTLVVDSDDPAIEKPVIINLSSAFFNVDAFDFMKRQPDATFDHIITDPDYGLSLDTLSANSSNLRSGVAQEAVGDSLSDTFNLIHEAFRLIKPQGFLIFWYDLDHHEKFQVAAINEGFAVQHWPLIWHKEDYRSNAAPSYNFAKNMEYAMVCRKPNAVLARAQLSSIFRGPGQPTVKQFHHPFAKSLDLMKWIFSAIAIKGQTTYDPFMGSGAICCAAAEWGLRPVGTEISVDHYPNAIMNLQRTYRKLIGKEVIFR